MGNNGVAVSTLALGTMTFGDETAVSARNRHGLGDTLT